MWEPRFYIFEPRKLKFSGKKLWELIEPCDVRIRKVKDFLEEVDPSLEYNVIPINDIYGPTKDDPTFQVCEKVSSASAFQVNLIVFTYSKTRRTNASVFFIFKIKS